jgi:hypothetical protein
VNLNDDLVVDAVDVDGVKEDNGADEEPVFSGAGLRVVPMASLAEVVVPVEVELC